MTTTTIIPKSALEKRYEEAKERFNNEYDNSRYDLYEKDYYLGHGYTGWERLAEKLRGIEDEIAKSYTEDAAPEDWEKIKDKRNDQLAKVSEIYEHAARLVKLDNKRYQEIEDNVRAELIERLGDLHYQGNLEIEVDLGDELVDTEVEYFIYDYTRDVKGTYDTPPYVDGVTVVDYTINVYDEEGNHEQEIEGRLKI